MQALVLAMVVGGVTLLVMALAPIRPILRTLGSGRLRVRWQWLYRLILGFIVGYAAFGVFRLGTATTTVADFLVAAILLAGGAFVLIVAQLSDLTTSDIVRIASLERDVVRDPMTGAYNRRYLESRLDEEISRARRSGTPLSALMIDLDHFKHVNDTYGHQIGDDVIRHVSALIMGQVRASDIVVRYGGEEFLVLVPDGTLELATHLGRRLLGRVRSQAFTLPGGVALASTVSIGVAALANGETQAAFIQRADDALYDAKRSGRDRLCATESSPAEDPSGS